MNLGSVVCIIDYPLTCNEWFELTRDGFALSDRSIDVIEEVGLGVGGVKVGRFARVHYGSATHGKKGVKVFRLGKVGGGLKTKMKALV